jgi:hypothetical protein
MRKMAMSFFGTLSCFVLVFVLIRWWVVSHLDFSQVGQVSAISPVRLAKEVDSLALDIKEGKTPSRKVDLASVGAPEEEAQLLGLRHLVEVFEVGFRRPPKDASELQQLILQASPMFRQRRLLDEDARECGIFTFPQDSYLLNCDGWRPAEPNDLRSLVERFDSEIEKFYVVEGHVFLYAPPSNARPYKLQ